MWLQKFIYLLVLFSLIFNCIGQQTKVRRNEVLRRNKRYVVFPQGSNFLLTASLVKAIMVEVPKGWNVLVECDCMYPLPSFNDYQKIRHRHKREVHIRQRRDIYEKIEILLDAIGLNPTACIETMKCEADELARKSDKSIAEEALIAIFRMPEFALDEKNNRTEKVCEEMYAKCNLRLLEFLLNPSD